MKNRVRGLLKLFKLNESAISTILGALVIVVVGILVINYFRNAGRPSAPEVKEEATTVQGGTFNPENLPTSYTVKEGDDLWKIAEKFFGSGYNWVSIARENKLTNPNIISAGQEITIPKAEVIRPEAAIQTGESITGSTYTVQKNDHLWNIALRAYGDGYQWLKIAQENKLGNPNLIHPGNILRLPR